MVEPHVGKRPTRTRFRLRPFLPERLQSVKFSLLDWHLLYFVVLYVPTSILVWAVVQGGVALDWWESLFVVISAGTGAGLNNVPLSDLNTFQQTVLFLLIALGSPLFVASILVNVCRHRHKRFLDSLENRLATPSLEHSEERDLESASPQAPHTDSKSQLGPPITVSDNPSSGGTTIVDATPAISRIPSGTSGPPAELQLGQPVDDGPSQQYRDYLDTYSALYLLSWIVPIYFIGLQLFGGLALGAWIVSNAPSIPATNDVNPWWWGYFNAVSAFNNSGMSLLNANMTPFATRGQFVLLVQAFLILAGNSCFPVFLSCVLWLMGKMKASGDRVQWLRSGIKILADEKKGRLIFPYIFSRMEVWWLFGTIVVLNGVDWISYEIAAPGTPGVQDLSIGQRWLTGFFQAVSVRSGGFAVVNIADLHIGVQFLYAVMMYISVYPLVLNPYYEAELPGIRSPLRSSTLRLLLRPQVLQSRTNLLTFLKHQFRGLLRAGDLSWLAACVWVIAILESGKMHKNPSGFSVFGIMFEVASGYGCVGVSLGDPSGAPLSYSGAWRRGSRVVLAGVMIAGRLREVRRGILVGDWGVQGNGVLETKRKEPVLRNADGEKTCVNPTIEH